MARIRDLAPQPRHGAANELIEAPAVRAARRRGIRGDHDVPVRAQRGGHRPHVAYQPGLEAEGRQRERRREAPLDARQRSGKDGEREKSSGLHHPRQPLVQRIRLARAVAAGRGRRGRRRAAGVARTRRGRAVRPGRLVPGELEPCRLQEVVQHGTSRKRLGLGIAARDPFPDLLLGELRRAEQGAGAQLRGPCGGHAARIQLAAGGDRRPCGGLDRKAQNPIRTRRLHARRRRSFRECFGDAGGGQERIGFGKAVRHPAELPDPVGAGFHRGGEGRVQSFRGEDQGGRRGGCVAPVQAEAAVLAGRFHLQRGRGDRAGPPQARFAGLGGAPGRRQCFRKLARRHDPAVLHDQRRHGVAEPRHPAPAAPAPSHVPEGAGHPGRGRAQRFGDRAMGRQQAEVALHPQRAAHEKGLVFRDARGDELGGQKVDAPDGGIDRVVRFVNGGGGVEGPPALREVLGEALRQLPDDLDDALPDPLVAVEADAGQIDELGDRMRPEAIQRVQQAGTEAEREERRLAGHAIEVARQITAFLVARGLDVDGSEATGPRAAHLFRAVEADPVVPGQRLGEELGERAAHRGIEPLRIEGDLLLDQHGVGQAVPPSGQVSDRHLVERHGRGETLGVDVPARWAAQPQEGIQVLRRARADVLRGGVREGEVEHDEGERPVGAARGYADVVGLQVPMRDPLLLQPLHDAQQLASEAFQEIEREPALLADTVREGVGAAPVLGAGHRDEQRRVPGQLHVAVERDDVRMAQHPQHLAFAPDALVARGIEGHLEHSAAVVVLHLEGDGGGALAEAPLHEEAMLQHVPRIGVERVDDGLLSLVRSGELPLRLHEQVQELRDGIGAPADLRVGRGLHDQLQGSREAVERIGEPEAAGARQARVQVRDGGRRRHVREQPVADGAEGEDVELLGDVSPAGRLRCEIHVAFVLAREAGCGLRSGVPCSGGSRAPERVHPAGPPVEDLERGPGGVRRRHQDLPRTQRAMAEAAFVRVLQRLRQLAQHVETGREVQPAAFPAFEEMVQAFGVRVVFEDQGRSLLRVREQLHPQDALVDDAVEQLVLPLRRALLLGAHRPGGGRRERVDTHPPLRRGHRDVLGFPVLVVVRLQQELAQHVVRHPPLPLRWMDPRLLHRTREGPGERPVDPRRRPARIEARVPAKDVEDARTRVPLGPRGEVHPRAGPAIEPAPHPATGQEYDGFDVRPALPGERLLRLQEPDQLFRLAVRQQERTVDQELPAVDLAAPRAGVARDAPAPALDLDEVDLVERHHEQVDFVDAAVLGDELEIRPRAKRLAVRQAGLQVVEGLALPGVFGGGDLDPAGGFHCRSIANSFRTGFRRPPQRRQDDGGIVGVRLRCTAIAPYSETFHESPPTELAFIHVVRGHRAGAGGESRPRQRSGTKGRPMQAGVFTFVRTRLPEINTSAAIVTR